MSVSKEILLEELGSAKHCIEMTSDKIGHEVTSDKIVAVLNDRIKELESEVDATISAQVLGADMRMDVA